MAGSPEDDGPVSVDASARRALRHLTGSPEPGLAPGAVTSRRSRPSSRPRARQRPMSWPARLDQPRSEWWCGLGWCASTAVFFFLVQLLGGPTRGDAVDFGHHHLGHCSRAAAVRLPQGTAAHCSRLPVSLGRGGGDRPRRAAQCGSPPGRLWGRAVTRRSRPSPDGRYEPTLCRGRCGSATSGGSCSPPASCSSCVRAAAGNADGSSSRSLVVACLPPVWMCIETFFHPEDLVALGLAWPPWRAPVATPGSEPASSWPWPFSPNNSPFSSRCRFWCSHQPGDGWRI